jgi:TonB family protein
VKPPPSPGDGPKPGIGDRGVKDQSPSPVAADGVLPPAAKHPTETPGKAEPTPPARVPLPRIAPSELAEPEKGPPEAKRRPQVALLAVPAPPAAATPFRPEPPRPGFEAPKPAATDPAPAVNPEDLNLSRPVVPPPPAERPAPPVAGTGDGRRPGPPRPAADPAQESDSESDAFSRIGAASFRDGKLDVQFGRKVKTVRPRLLVAGQVDAFALRNPSVTLKVHIDATGKVTQVAVHKSSGSNEIDQPCRVAMYEWWFEPLKDKNGTPIPDVILFTISFR